MCLCRSVFNDGFPNVFVRDALDIRNRHVAFLCSFHEPSVIFEQISVIYALPRLFISSFTLVLPFFPTGTLERVRASCTECGASHGRAEISCSTSTSVRVQRSCAGPWIGSLHLCHWHLATLDHGDCLPWPSLKRQLVAMLQILHVDWC